MALFKCLPDSCVTLFADFRSGTCRDFSPLARHGSIAGTDVRFSPQGAHEHYWALKQINKVG